MTQIDNFYFSATSELKGQLHDLTSQYVVLYFYPKDNTPGCTRESKDFRDLYPEFIKCKATIFGISKDSLDSHEKFKEKLNLPFDLISDTDGKLCHLFSTGKESFLKKFTGIGRCTFVIGPDRTLLREWRNVKVTGHAEEVLNFLFNQSPS
ncbi:MAG: putative peroxiredoxin bcp [Chlamydiae bacterium]|nr:putative peroxiredoxin bcp [Chlamydiota bacterium]